jgi:hypothetical protein
MLWRYVLLKYAGFYNILHFSTSTNSAQSATLPLSNCRRYPCVNMMAKQRVLLFLLKTKSTPQHSAIPQFLGIIPFHHALSRRVSLFSSRSSSTRRSSASSSRSRDLLYFPLRQFHRTYTKSNLATSFFSKANRHRHHHESYFPISKRNFDTKHTKS